MSERNSILVSGNPAYGLAKSLHQKFPGATFASRRLGFDFTLPADRQRFAALSLGHEVYISCSALTDSLQRTLLAEVYEAWQLAGKGGRILVIGSSLDSNPKPDDRPYAHDKRALRDYCASLSLRTGASPIQLALLSPGYLNTPSILRKFPQITPLDCDYVADLAAWLLRHPPIGPLHYLSLDPIQPHPHHA